MNIRQIKFRNEQVMVLQLRGADTFTKYNLVGGFKAH